MKNRSHYDKKYLYTDVEIDVRFNEVDTLRIVWHGHYINYFEQAREAFGNRYGMGYLDMLKHEIAVPITAVNAEYRKSLRYGDKAIVRAYFIPSAAAKIVFEYNVYHAETMDLCATGSTEQVFMDPRTSELYFYFPDMYKSWLDQLPNVAHND